MAGDTIITVVGNLTADPELRFTPSGAAVASFTDRLDAAHLRPQHQRVEGRRGAVPALLDLAAGGRERRRVADPRHARHRTGRLQQRSYETREGEKRTVIELQVDEIGPSLKYASAKVNRTQRGSSSGGGFGSSGSDAGGGGAAPADDPWGSAPAAGSAALSDEPPF